MFIYDYVHRWAGNHILDIETNTDKREINIYKSGNPIQGNHSPRLHVVRVTVVDTPMRDTRNREAGRGNGVKWFRNVGTPKMEHIFHIERFEDNMGSDENHRILYIARNAIAKLKEYL